MNDGQALMILVRWGENVPHAVDAIKYEATCGHLCWASQDSLDYQAAEAERQNLTVVTQCMECAGGASVYIEQLKERGVFGLAAAYPKLIQTMGKKNTDELVVKVLMLRLTRLLGIEETS